MRNDYGYFEEDQLGRVGDARLWRRIILLGLPEWPGIVLAVLLSFLVVGCGLALPYLLRLVIDDFVVNTALGQAERLAGIARLAGLFLLVMAAGFIVNFCQVLVLAWTGQKIMHRMRQMLFNHLLGLNMRFFNNNPGGKLVTRLTNDIQNMNEMFTSVIVTLFNDFINLTGILAVLFWMNWRLALLMAALVPLVVGNTIWFSRLSREAFRAIRTHLARINAFLQESLAGIAIIQLFLREPETEASFKKLDHEYYEKSLYQIKIFGMFMPLIELLGAVAIGAIIWYGGVQIMAGAMTIGVLVAFLSYMRLFFQPLKELSQKYAIVQSALASAERIFELQDSRALLPAAANPQRPAHCRGRIEFARVGFGYAPGQPVLKDFSLTIEPGEILAIVGATGSGKSTVINLLERFYDPDQGRVLLDGVDLRDLDPEWLRSQIGLVMQDVFVLSGTIRENILLDSHLDDAGLQAILARAQLQDFVARLPEGLDTKVGEGGRDLSAGERQLLAFARLLVRDCRVLILDEATSSVDAESEMYIEQATRASLAGRTSIIIAHRLSTVRRADRILVMEKGEIIEQGSHAQLVAAHGQYYRLLESGNGS
ncbi:MAG: ABC transporter ATP-binding protein/permease [Desulfobulbaceae bacterium]|nr:ABC transporter ATP-binding protein/permease [Desulfobulbaceae bacterium]HIJ78592.1 ABC transporter ATP-binding protein [Deltaproteobacteria bacterium]